MFVFYIKIYQTNSKLNIGKIEIFIKQSSHCSFSFKHYLSAYFSSKLNFFLSILKNKISKSKINKHYESKEMGFIKKFQNISEPILNRWNIK